MAAVALHLERRGHGRVTAPAVVLAAGGNESTRLLLAEQRRDPGLFGGADGPLGRFYMGHVNGQIAEIELASAALDAGLDFHQDGQGSYVRRRLVPSEATQERERLTNVAFWPVVPPIADPAHRSGPLSAVFLALSAAPLGRRLIAEPIRLKHVGEPPYRRGRHLANLLRDRRTDARLRAVVPLEDQAGAAAAAGAVPQEPGAALRARIPRRAPAAPGEPADARHCHRPGRAARLRIDLRFSEADAEAVVRAHDALEAWLVRNRLGRLAGGPAGGTGGGGAGRGPARQPPDRHDPHGARPGHGGGRWRMPQLRLHEPLRRLDRGAADLGPGQSDDDRGPARPPARRAAGGRARSSRACSGPWPQALDARGRGAPAGDALLAVPAGCWRGAVAERASILRAR